MNTHNGRGGTAAVRCKEFDLFRCVKLIEKRRLFDGKIKTTVAATADMARGACSPITGATMPDPQPLHCASVLYGNLVIARAFSGS
jgi:hypothetical protein